MTKKIMTVTSDISSVRKTTHEVLEFMKTADLSQEALHDIRLCFEEALVNAIKHGSQLKPGKKITLELEVDSQKARIAVEDEGSGFDPDALEDCTAESNLLKKAGRGIYLIRQFMDEVSFNTKGNRIQMVKRIARVHRVV